VINHRANNFDALRFALATAVIFSHSYPLTRGESEAFEPLHWFSHGQIWIGAAAVNCFFIISGFLITQSWLRCRGLVDFFRKRVLRIYPGYLVNAAVCLLIVAPMAGADIHKIVSLKDGPRHILKAVLLRGVGLQAPLVKPDSSEAPQDLDAAPPRDPIQTNAFPTNPMPGALNGSLWSIRFEFACYVLTPVIASIGLLKRRRWMVALTVAVLACQVALSIIDPFEGGMAEKGPRFASLHLLLRCMVLYFAGVLACLYEDRLPHGRGWAAAALAAFVAAALVPPAMMVVAPVALTFLVFWFAFEPRIGCQNFAKYGDFSYGIYLYAFPIQQLLVMVAGPMQPVTLFLATLAPTFAAAGASWFLVERPCLRLKSRAARPSTSLATPMVMDLSPVVGQPSIERQR
jgi:peptidoglycan/LPS O-acetylase OafA/YrhL